MGRVFLVVGVPTVARKMDFVLKCVTLANPAYGGPSQVGGSPDYAGVFGVLVPRRLTFGMVSGFSASLHFVRISLFLLKTNDALFPAPDRFPQVSFRLRSVSFGQDHHVLRTRNRACIAGPRDFIVPASNVVLHHLKKRSRKTMFSAINGRGP